MATAIPDYYCHKCQVRIGHVTNFTCPHCLDSFIEEVSAEHSSSHSRGVRPHNRRRIHFHGSTPYRSTTIFLGDSSSSRDETYQTINPDIGTFFHAVLAQLAGGAPQVSSGIHTVEGESSINSLNLDAFLTQFLNQIGENAGPAPASENRISSIPTVRITAEQARDCLQCAICMDDFKENDQAKRLPCSHHFHEACILRWLRMHGTCPTCRVTLDGDNTSNREYLNTYPNQGRSSSRNNNSRNNRDDNGPNPTSRSTLFDFD